MLSGLIRTYIPSPSSSRIHLGPLALNAYGICIALGIFAGIAVASRRWSRMGGSPDEIGRVGTWAVPAGIVGARLYHLATDWRSYQHHLGDTVKIWQGGLGIWGGVALGTIVGVLAAKGQKLRLGPLFHAAAPSIAVSQAIGRWGNWFNIELFGKPTTVPWALKVPPSFRPSGYQRFATYHPTFLYESLWDLALALTIIALSKTIWRRFKPGAAFAIYVLLYTFGRFFIERIRIDNATHVGGIRINEIVAPIVFAGALIVTIAMRRKPNSADPGPESVSPLVPSQLVEA